MRSTLTCPDWSVNIATPTGKTFSELVAELLFYFDFDGDTVMAFRREKAGTRVVFEDLTAKDRYSITLGGHRVAGFRDHYLSERTTGKHGANNNTYILELQHYLSLRLAANILPTFFDYLIHKSTRAEFEGYLMLTLKDFKEYFVRVMIGISKNEVKLDESVLEVMEGYRMMYDYWNSLRPVPAKWKAHFTGFGQIQSWQTAKRQSEVIMRKIFYCDYFPFGRGVDRVVERHLAPMVNRLAWTCNQERWSSLRMYLPAIENTCEALRLAYLK